MYGPGKRDLFETLNKYGITEDAITDAAMELYVPHPGIACESRGSI